MLLCIFSTITERYQAFYLYKLTDEYDILTFYNAINATF